MTEYTIAQIVVGLPVEGPFDYFIPQEWRGRIVVGQRVAVMFAHVKRLGVVVALQHGTDIKNVKPLTKVLGTQPWFDDYLLHLARDMKKRYGCSSGEALELMLPKALRSTRSLELERSAQAVSTLDGQRTWIRSQNTRDHWSLIQTRIKEVLSHELGVIVLVADSAQIPYVVSQVKSVLPEKIVIHDNERTAKEELEGWSMLRSGQRKVIVGLRSAVFAPIDPLGLIVLYDEDNPSFREEQSPFYQTREVVMMRANIHQCGVLIVTFSSTVELVFHSQPERLTAVDYSEPQKARRQLIDMTNFESKGPMMISFPMRNNLEKALGAGQKAMIVINRRGHSTVTRCLFCGHMMRCPRCTTNLSYSAVKKRLECRRCFTSQDLPKKCPHCGKEYLRSLGVGVERVVQEIRRLFPAARTQRFDRDVQVFPPQFDVLVTTQAVLRMLGRVVVHTIGILDVDTEFNRADYRSSQKAFSLLTHLSLMAKENIVIQTMNIDNETLRSFISGKDQEFYQNELLLRKELKLPPYQHWVAVLLRGPEEKIVSIQAEALYNSLAENTPSGIDVMPVRPDGMPKLRDQYRFVIFIRGEQASATLDFVKESIGKLKKKSKVIITVQVDP
ncbi:MAG: primosomal protein N' [Candidatus Omnitrophica bacterium]|nr:primosomal protein N' [Candidatus Omnitrophota bacterium]